MFKNSLITRFGQFEFEDSYRQQLRELAQVVSISMASFVARTTDIFVHAYPNFTTEVKLDLAVEYFVFGLRDTSPRDYLWREPARCRINWKDAVQMAQTCKQPRASDCIFVHAAIASDTSSATFVHIAESITTSSNNRAITTPCATGNAGNIRRRHVFCSSRAFHKATGVLLILTTPHSRKRLRENLTLRQACHTALPQISTRLTRRTWLATLTCTLVRRVIYSRRLCSTITGNRNHFSTRRARSWNSCAINKRRVSRPHLIFAVFS